MTVLVVFVMPTSAVWLLGRRARIARGLLVVFLLTGWLTVLIGTALSQRAQPGLFPEMSPCGRHGSPVSQYFPPDSFCRGAEGELRTVNGPDAKLVFWTVANTTVATAIAAVFVRRRRRA
ncbi:hypothetical protein EV562_113166 [Streptomyces sp. BK208]|uniref:hypothetical protein n=1 Tax=Streptomyces sp. BK208 TaxID=2512150 RepID=UPI0010EF1973|nr:hypothetical protein EV562_113166 [Streptomyces sp. BK208]